METRLVPERPDKKSVAAAKVATNPAGEPGSPKRKKWVEAVMKRASEAEAAAADAAAERWMWDSSSPDRTIVNPFMTDEDFYTQLSQEDYRLEAERAEAEHYLIQDRIKYLKSLQYTDAEIRKEMLKFEDEWAKKQVRENIRRQDEEDEFKRYWDD